MHQGNVPFTSWQPELWTSWTAYRVQGSVPAATRFRAKGSSRAC